MRNHELTEEIIDKLLRENAKAQNDALPLHEWKQELLRRAVYESNRESLQTQAAALKKHKMLRLNRYSLALAGAAAVFVLLFGMRNLFMNTKEALPAPAAMPPEARSFTAADEEAGTREAPMEEAGILMAPEEAQGLQGDLAAPGLRAQMPPQENSVAGGSAVNEDTALYILLDVLGYESSEAVGAQISYEENISYLIKPLDKSEEYKLKLQSVYLVKLKRDEQTGIEYAVDALNLEVLGIVLEKQQP